MSLVGKIKSSVLDMAILMCSWNFQIPGGIWKHGSGVLEKGLDWGCGFGCCEPSGGDAELISHVRWSWEVRLRVERDRKAKVGALGTLEGLAGEDKSADGTQKGTAGKCGENAGQPYHRIQKPEVLLQSGHGQGLGVLSS